jgi:XTP/dITP diphosphohydrolase
MNWGDLIFSLVNAARLYDIDPESALERTNQKFIRRFNYLEEQTLLKGKSLHAMSLAEMDFYWDEAKKGEKR